jgi:BarA-like signal transduction histidine kinase
MSVYDMVEASIAKAIKDNVTMQKKFLRKPS